MRRQMVFREFEQSSRGRFNGFQFQEETHEHKQWMLSCYHGSFVTGHSLSKSFTILMKTVEMSANGAMLLELMRDWKCFNT